MFNISKPRTMSATAAKNFLLLSALVSLAAFCAHTASFSPTPIISMEQVWPIHVAIFIPFFGMIWAINSGQPEVERQFNEGWWGWSRRRNEEAQKHMRNLIKRCPSGVRIFSIVLFVYVFINFFTFMGETTQGSPTEKNGKFYISNHGRIIREIDEKEYLRLKAYEVRGFSGHWMVFSYVPFVYFRFIHRNKEDAIHDYGATSFPNGET